MNKESTFIQSASRIARWLVTNQVRDVHDANNGRFPGSYIPDKGESSLSYSINWTTAAALKGLLLMYQHTGDRLYLESAVQAGEYIKSLQLTGTIHGKHEGAFREITPQASWCFPRDALTASWGLLRLYQVTEDKDCLHRVELFNQWFFRVAFTGDWPLWKVNFTSVQDLPPSLQGSFHGGVSAYFRDYCRITGSTKWMEQGVKGIVQYLLKIFLQENGEYRIIWDAGKKSYLDGKDSHNYPLSWQRMHRYNDDFSSLGLLGAFLYYKNPLYLEMAEKFARWLLSKQNSDGSFGKPPVPSASATSILLFLDLHELTGKKEYYKPALSAAAHLVSLQDKNTGSQRSFGGLYGEPDELNCQEKVLNLRVTSYALIALLRLAGNIKIPYYSAAGQ